MYTAEQVAELLQVSKAFVDRLLRDGLIKGFKIGKLWRVNQSALDDYCVSCANSGKGKRSLSPKAKTKIQFHANLRSHEKLP
ncbi:MAG: helix-turn-helix domain-containing protein, partial [Deltaproteobacteria bacterium]|nr:helix-turn-helix domain-containing protein [Deltaproteobacteria bacterium]